MSAEQNKAIACRFFDECDRLGSKIADRSSDAILGELLAPNFVAHAPEAPGPMGLQDWRQFEAQGYTAFPDLRPTIEDQIAEGDKVAVRTTSRGTHRGELQGMRPTGKKIEATAITILRIADGKIAEMWAEYDLMGLMQQFGAVPTMQAVRP